MSGAKSIYYRPVAASGQIHKPTLPGRVLFPVAAAFAALAVPGWLALRPHAHQLDAAAWHTHEMLFGYALAVVAGFLVTRPSRATVWVLVLTWLAGRTAMLQGIGPAALITGLAFPVVLLAAAAPPLLRGAKRPENLILPGVLALLVAADVLWWIANLWLSAEAQQRGLLATVDLFALLMLTVGGRVLPAAVGGHLERLGGTRHDHLRREYELPLVALLGSACVLDLAGMGAAAGWLCIAAALLTLWRIGAWQLHRTLGRPALWALALGYVWLVPGLLLKGLAQALEVVPLGGALHGVTVGALGTLTLVMMARTAALRARRSLEGFADVGAGALLISAAALARLAAPHTAHPDPLLWIAAAAWSLAFTLLFVRLLRMQRP